MSPQARKELAKRLSMIEGQVRGLRAMIEDGRDFHEVLAQSTAIGQAARATRAVLIADHLEGEVRAAIADPTLAERRYDEICAVIKKF